MAQRFASLLVAFLVYLTVPSFADEAQRKVEIEAAWAAAEKTMIKGPSDVALLDQATLHLPSEMAFIPKPEAAGLMKVWGNSESPTLAGLVISMRSGDGWVMSVNHIAEGYVKDDDAKSWDIDALLQSLKDGNEQQNEERIKMGIPALDIVGWIEKPVYDAVTHRLVWSIKGVDRGAAPGTDATVNYNTYALGRDGYLEVNLMTNAATVEAQKPAARKVLAAIDYKAGKRYEDFVAGTDHIAEYGLMALIGGIAAKKLGLLALGGLFLAKFAKIILIAMAAFGASIFKFFRRKPAGDA
jgi:uncharacterized membrane-anchored protein